MRRPSRGSATTPEPGLARRRCRAASSAGAGGEASSASRPVREQDVAPGLRLDPRRPRAAATAGGRRRRSRAPGGRPCRGLRVRVQGRRTGRLSLPRTHDRLECGASAARSRSRARSPRRPRSPARSGARRGAAPRTGRRRTAGGCAKSVARDGPTRSIAVNQRMFVRKSGPTTANANASAIVQPKPVEALLGELRDARRARAAPSRARARAS